jgi:hypothetical protein
VLAKWNHEAIRCSPWQVASAAACLTGAEGFDLALLRGDGIDVATDRRARREHRRCAPPSRHLGGKGRASAFAHRDVLLATDSRRFRFRHQVRDNVFHTLVYGVQVVTAYEAITYRAFANGYLGPFDLYASPVLFWG